MTAIRKRYDITAFKKPKYFVAQVSEHDLSTGDYQMWCYTQGDLIALVTQGTEPIKIVLKHWHKRSMV